MTPTIHCPVSSLDDPDLLETLLGEYQNLADELALEGHGSARRIFHNQEAIAAVARHKARLAATDELTALPNYRETMRHLFAEFDRAVRYGHPLTVLVLDLDNFGQYNREVGHFPANIALSTCGACFPLQVRSADVVGRAGGEEFLVIMPETAEAEGLVLANRICESVSQLPVPGGPLSVSIGQATLMPYDDCPETLLSRADLALYFVKANGKSFAAAWRPGFGWPLGTREPLLMA